MNQNDGEHANVDIDYLGPLGHAVIILNGPHQHQHLVEAAPTLCQYTQQYHVQVDLLVDDQPTLADTTPDGDTVARLVECGVHLFRMSNLLGGAATKPQPTKSVE